MGWDVVMTDADPQALARIKNDIYPKRYGAWDAGIQLFRAGEEPKAGFDVIIIGTPPDSHAKLALAAIAENPRLLHIEKPLATPDLAGIAEFEEAMREHPQTIVTVGYDHAVSESAEFVRSFSRGYLFEVELQTGSPTSNSPIGEILTIDVEFREHWRGIFGAHPWLAGPWETYLGYWQRGGGAGGEHSHALHLWFYFARALGWSGAREVKAMFDMKSEQGAEYDRIAAFLLKSENGGMGRVVQDVVTYPVKKWARLQGEKGYIEWHCNGIPAGDLVRYQIEGQDAVEKVFPKKRPDDFYRETLHYQKLLSGEIRPEDSPLSYGRGREVMAVLHGSYLGR